MRKYLILVLAGAALAACQQQPSSEATETETAAPLTASGAPIASATPDATVAGANSAAPCTGGDCPRPASGYDWAEAHNIDDTKDCTVGDQDFKDGCALYVQEKAVDEGEKEFESDGE